MDSERLFEFRTWAALAAVRGCLMAAITAVGIVLTLNIQGSEFFVLEGSGDLSPACFAIMYPLATNDINVKKGLVDGSALVVQPTVGEQLAKGVTISSTAVAASSSFTTEECSLVALLLEDPEFETDGYTQEQVEVVKDRKVLLVNGLTGVQIEMPAECGGSKPGLWDDADESRKEGMNGTIYIIGLLAWFLMRLMSLGIEYAASYDELNNDSKWYFKIPFQFAVLIMFTWTTSVLVSPMQNMKVSELCPQLMTTFYSSTAQGLLSTMAIFVIPYLCLVATQMYSEDMEGEAAYYFLTVLAVHGRTGLQKMFRKNKGEVVCGVLLTMMPLMPVATIILTVFYKYEMISGGDPVEAVGQSVNLDMRFPSVSLSAKLNVFHVLNFLMLALDWTNFLKGIVFKLFKLRKVVRRVAPAEEG
eukprot:TRINITY_DN20265_c0_g1_i2.p1 TRINITY_DN20265_c0_g1~~TRINITY_DN20265_c0_g1_i2.p1  ORF type:complete len:417 (-),score=53.22 TRINITY_DN20265_c0_g1_i2:350-1600(-)